MVLPAIGWTLALPLPWTRWSRPGIVLGIAAQVDAGVVLGEPVIARVDYQMGDVTTASYLDLEPLLKSFLPACLPVLPLPALVLLGLAAVRTPRQRVNG